MSALSVKCSHKAQSVLLGLPVFICADRRAQSPHTRLHPPIHPFTHPSLITSSHSLVLLCSLSPYRSCCTLLWHIFMPPLLMLPFSPGMLTCAHKLHKCDFVLRLDLDASPEELDFSFIIRPYVDFLFHPLNSCPEWQWADAVQPGSFYQH